MGEYKHILYRKAIKDLIAKAEELRPAADALGYGKSHNQMIGALQDHRITVLHEDKKDA